MTARTMAVTLCAGLAVPAFVLAQGYRDVRARLQLGGVDLDVRNQITEIGGPSVAWPMALLGIVLAGALVTLAAPRRGPALPRLLPLLVATAMLGSLVVAGKALTDPPGVLDWSDPGYPSLWSIWVRTGLHGPAAPALLGVLVVLSVRAVQHARLARRTPELSPAPSGPARPAARAVAAVMAVPALVMAQGYLDVRALANANGVVLDATTTQITGITGAAPTWVEGLVTAALAAALLTLVLPGPRGGALRLRALLVAAALLATTVVIGGTLEPPDLISYIEQGGPQPVRYWLRTGALSPVMPLLLGTLLALGARTHTRPRGPARVPDRSTKTRLPRRRPRWWL